MSFSRSTKKSFGSTPRQGTYHLDQEIKKINRLIRKNDNMRGQLMERAADLDEERIIMSSPTRRVRELRATSLQLRDENEMLKHKLKLTKRLRERVQTMRQASIATWKAYGGRGKTRDLTLAHAKILALETECEELQSTQLDALRDGLNANISTNEVLQKLRLMTTQMEEEKERKLAEQAKNNELTAEIKLLKESMDNMRLQLIAMEKYAEKNRVEEIRLKTSEQMLRKSAKDEQTASAHLKRRLVQARSDAEESQARERKLRLHIAGIAATGAGARYLGDPLVGGGYGPYLDPVLYTSSAYNLSPSARRYYLDNIAANNAYLSTTAAQNAVSRQIDQELEFAAAVDRDVDSMKRSRDYERLALLRTEADLGLSSSSDIVEKTLLESKLEVEAALNKSNFQVRDL
jgi:hypothetical protein